VIQLAVRAAVAVEPSAAADRTSNLKLAAGRGWLVLDEEAVFKADGEPQAIASNTNNDAIPAARVIGVTSCNGRLRVRLWARR
jgi:hypothetical protein